MTTLELLKEYLDRELNNIFVCSSDYRMDSPKRGYEHEFREASEKVEVLQYLITRLESESQR